MNKTFQDLPGVVIERDSAAWPVARAFLQQPRQAQYSRSWPEAQSTDAYIPAGVQVVGMCVA